MRTEVLTLQRSLRWAALCATAVAVLPVPAQAVLLRTGYDVQGSPNYNRYTTLAKQTRFDTVGNIQLYDTIQNLSAFGFHNSCTGTLISPSVILTAAHCFSDGAGNVKSFSQNASLSAMPIQQGKQVFFATGSNLATNSNASLGPIYSSKSIQYAAQVDLLSIYPGYNSNLGNQVTFDGDLALLRVYNQPWFGAQPTNYLPLNVGTGEASIQPTFGVTVGYGNTGNGTSGYIVNGFQQKNPAIEKRAGLVEVKYDILHPNTLTAKFTNPTKYASLLYPSNFLGATTGPGDSGGPLVANLGSGDTIIGVLQGGGPEPMKYDSQSWWTRVSSFASWIQSEATKLSGQLVTALFGTTPSEPLLPQVSKIINGIVSKTFTFLASPSFPTFLDPTGGGTLDVQVDSGPKITSVFLPTDFSTAAEVWQFDPVLAVFFNTGKELSPGAWFDFDDPVSAFRLVGLPDSYDLTLGFKFADVGLEVLTWTFTPNESGPGSTVPEPSSFSLLFGTIVLSGLWLRRKPRRRVLV